MFQFTLNRLHFKLRTGSNIHIHMYISDSEPDKIGLNLMSRAGQIRLRTILSFIQKNINFFSADFRSQLSLFVC